MHSLTFHTTQDWGQTLAAEGPVLTVYPEKASAFSLVRTEPGGTLSFTIRAAVRFTYSYREEMADFLRTITVTAARSGLRNPLGPPRKTANGKASRNKARLLLQNLKRLRL